MRAARLYQEYVAAGLGVNRSPWEDLRDNLYLGSVAFVGHIEELRAKKEAVSPRGKGVGEAVDTSAVAEAVERHFYTSLNPRRCSNEFPRLAFARVARSEALATHGAIADRLRLSAAGARSLLNRAACLEASSREFSEHIDAITRQLMEIDARH